MIADDVPGCVTGDVVSGMLVPVPTTVNAVYENPAAFA
jgi:hypothetical protein